MRSVVVAPRLQSTGSIAMVHVVLCNMWDPPGSGIDLMSPALAGGVFTAEPPGKP